MLYEEMIKVRVGTSTHERLTDIALSRGISLSGLVRMILLDWLRREADRS